MFSSSKIEKNRIEDRFEIVRDRFLVFRRQNVVQDLLSRRFDVVVDGRRVVERRRHLQRQRRLERDVVGRHFGRGVVVVGVVVDGQLLQLPQRRRHLEANVLKTKKINLLTFKEFYFSFKSQQFKVHPKPILL